MSSNILCPSDILMINDVHLRFVPLRKYHHIMDVLLCICINLAKLTIVFTVIAIIAVLVDIII